MSNPVKQPLLLLVSGPPASGKTTLARRIAAEFGLPLIAKDEIKERLFDTLGWSDRQWSKQLGGATFELLFYFLETILAGGDSLIIEANFKPFHEERLRNIQQASGCRTLQVACQADGEVLWQRFKDRAESGERHPGHVDHLNYAEFERLMKANELPSALTHIGGSLYVIDTTDILALERLEPLFDFIRAFIPDPTVQ